jgi:arylsulfatase A-like enzyme
MPPAPGLPTLTTNQPDEWRQRLGHGDKPDIVVIWGDDIGISNLSCHSDGLMGYRTPDIDLRRR